MAKKKYVTDSPSGESSSSSEAAGFSGFGGHSLTAMPKLTVGGGEDGGGEALIDTLNEIGVEDAEQLVALLAVPDTREKLQDVLGAQKQRFATVLKEIESTVPPERIAALNQPAEADLSFGALMPTEEMVAAAELATDAAITIDPVTLPSAVNLIPYMSVIRNQGSRGTCVAFALTALNEYILRRRGLIRDLSEQHLYYETKLIDGVPNVCGTWQAKGVIVLRTRGECRESIWPYNPNSACNAHGPLPPGARPDALNYRLNTIAVPARNVLAYKAQMALQRPVTVSIPVYNSWYLSAETRRSGRITMRIGSEAPVGGHALCLVGYQDSPHSPGGGFFIVRNSWGTTNWGYACPYGAGYGTIPYQYITNEAYIGESFTAALVGQRGENEEGDNEEEPTDTSESTVTIAVSPNVTITIATKK